MSVDNEIRAALDVLQGESKALFENLKERYDTLKQQHVGLQTQVDAIDAQGQTRLISGAPDDGTQGLKAIGETLRENKESLAKFGRMRFEVASLLPEGKSTILSTGLTSTEPASGIAGAGRFPYRLRKLFRTIPTQLPTIGVLRTTAENINASPQVQGDPKSESSFTFNLAQVAVQTIATFVNFSRQAMDDIGGFQEFLNSTLVWGLEGKAEAEILSGDGTGVHLPGLITGASAFDSTILSASGGWDRIDVLGAAAVQLQEAGYSPNFAVVSPRNWFRMISKRGTDGQYTLNNPRTAVGQRAYELDILVSNKITGDAFLVGDSGQAVIRQKMATTVEVSFEHGTNFTSNLATALAEERFGIQTSRPDAFVTGTLASSPA